jgi:hypothetical protein
MGLSAGHVRTVALGALVGLMVLVGTVSCTGDSRGPEPGPPPHYAPVPRDLCERMQVEDLAARFHLRLSPRYEPSTRYFEAPSFWAMICDFPTDAGDDRYATPSDEFDPSGTVSVTVYQEPADAVDEYRTHTDAFGRRYPEATHNVVGEVDGWWDQGAYLESIPTHDGEEAEVAESVLILTYVVQDENLYLEAYLTATFRADVATSAVAEVHEIMRALIDEAARHVTRSR